MAKREKKTQHESWDFPPDIFWITPDGVVKDVIGHLTEMQANPELFSLPSSPETKEEVDAAFETVFSDGWVRGRTEGELINFQMERPRGLPMGNAFDMALKYRNMLSEVAVEFYDPVYWKHRKKMSIDHFLNQKFPGSWGLGSKKRK